MALKGFFRWDDIRNVFPGSALVERLREATAGHGRFLGLAGILPPNFATVYEIRDVGGYDAIGVTLPSELSGAYVRGPAEPVVAPGAFSRRAAAAVVVAPSDEAPDLPSIEPLGSLVLLRDPSALPRIRFADGEADERERGPTIARDEPHLVSFTVDTRRRRRVIVADAWYAGWEARVDGRRTTVLREGGLRTVLVDAGPHEIELRYRPLSYRLGLFLTSLTSAMMAALGAARRPVRLADRASCAGAPLPTGSRAAPSAPREPQADAWSTRGG